MFYGLYAINLGVGAMLTYAWAPAAIPGSDMTLGILVTGLLSLFLMMVFTMLMASMPRSGGEYVAISRILNPVLGFAANWNMAIWSLFWIAMDTWIAVQWVIAPALTGLGISLNVPALVNMGIAIYDPVNTFILGSIIIFVIWLIMLAPLDRYMRLTEVMFVFAMISTALIIVLFALTSKEQFIGHLNNFMYPTYTSSTNAYADIITESINQGFDPYMPVSWLSTLAIVGPAFPPLGYAMWNVYHAGELKEGGRLKTQLIAIIGALIVGVALMAVQGWLFVVRGGADFVGAVGYLYYILGQQPMPIAPYMGFFPLIMTTNMLVIILIAIGFICWGLLWPFICVLPPTRCLFAWSFDGLMPSKVSEVHPKLKTPVIANTICAFAGWIFFALYTFTTFGTFLWASIYGSQFTFILVALTGIVFPFRRRYIYEASPAKKSIAGIPIISICGVIGIAFSLLVSYYFLVNPLLFANSPEAITFTTCVAISGFIIFAIAYYIRKRQKIDLSLVYKEIPPA